MIVMDTCAIIWDALDRSKITDEAAEAIEKADVHNALIVADISIWEIAMLIKRSRIEVDATTSVFLNRFLASRNVSVVSISPEIAELSQSFGAEISNDPADRIIAATSIIYNARLVTADTNLRASSLVDTLW